MEFYLTRKRKCVQCHFFGFSWGGRNLNKFLTLMCGFVWGYQLFVSLSPYLPPIPPSPHPLPPPLQQIRHMSKSYTRIKHYTFKESSTNKVDLGAVFTCCNCNVNDNSSLFDFHFSPDPPSTICTDTTESPSYNCNPQSVQ